MGLSSCACPLIHVANKCDLLPFEAVKRRTNDNSTVPILTSAVSGKGVSDLASAIVGRLVRDGICPRDAVPFTSLQVQHLQDTIAAIETGDLRTARTRLQQLLS
jgi:50S ribosomal subunit-associated GTPase HflX